MFPGSNQKPTMAFDLEMLDAPWRSRRGGVGGPRYEITATPSLRTILAAIAVLAPARVGGRTLPLAVTPGDVGREWGTSWFDGGVA